MGDYVLPNVLSPRDLVSRPDNMDETVPHTHYQNSTHNTNKLHIGTKKIAQNMLEVEHLFSLLEVIYAFIIYTVLFRNSF